MTTGYFSHPDCLAHDMGKGHPECPARLHAIDDHLRAVGLDMLMLPQDVPMASNQDLARDKVLAKRMSMASRTEALSAEEQVVLNDLERNVSRDSQRLENLDVSIREKRYYVYASEGFLQLLEKDEQQLIADDQEYLLDRSEEVGSLIARCAQQNLKWASLSESEQALLIDFGNIFENDCLARTEAALQEVEVGV
mgnify:CR=1 FL=1